jgi:predicted hydrolase (HD superfamily)
MHKERTPMEPHVPSREEALGLLREFTAKESLIRHALAVEGVMRFCAGKRGEDGEKWGVIGLVQDQGGS